MMPGLRNLAARLQPERLGVAGIVGVGLWLFCLSFAIGTLLPARQARLKLRNEEAALAATLVTIKTRANQANAPTAVELPPLLTAPELTSKLDDVASRSGLAIEHTSYRLSEKNRLQLLEVSLPLRTNYPTLRLYLKEALALGNGATLDAISLQRNQAADPLLDASLHLSYYFATP